MLPADIFFGLLVSFLIGVLAGSAGWNILAVFAVSVFVGVALIFFKKIRYRFVVAFLACLFLGAFYYHLYQNIRGAAINVPFNEPIVFSGVVQSEPKFTEKSQIVTLWLAPPFSGTISILAPRTPEFHYGEVLSVEGSVEPPEGNFLPTSVFPKIEGRSDAPPGVWLIKRKLIDLKLSFVGAFRKVLPADSAALLSGITFGYQSDFSKAFKEKMAASGTTHLVALSGYNIAIVVLLVAGALGRFFSRRATFYATALIILLFVLMVGAEASVVRAAIMGFLVLLAKESGRLYSFRNALTLAAFLMVLFDPSVLAFNLGFQLSFLSLLGIVYLEPALRSLFQRNNRRGQGKPAQESFLAWRENASTTLAAQLAVLPLLVQAFNEASFAALFANVLILSVVPATMMAGFILGVVSLLSGALGYLLAFFVDILLLYQIWVIDLFARVRLPIHNVLGGFAGTALYYLVLIGIIILSSRRKKHEAA